MTYYLLQKKLKHYIVRKGYSTLAQLCREFEGKQPLVIKVSNYLIYPGDKFRIKEIKKLLITVDTKKHKPFEGVRDEYSHGLPFDNLY